jgi:hypothetical protein
MRKPVFAMAVISTTIALLAPPAWATEGDPDPTARGVAGEFQLRAEPESTGWEWSVGAYFQAVDIDGTTTVGDTETDLELGFDVLIKKVKMAFSAHVEGWNDRFGVAADILYAKVGEDGLETGVPALTVEKGRFEITNMEFFGGYRIGAPAGSAGALDIIGGARYRKLKLGIDLDTPIGVVSGGFDEGWWDYMLGGRWLMQRGRWAFVARADFGQHAYNLQGGVGFSASDRLKLLLQYKYLKFDYVSGSGDARFGYDATESGPLLGIVYVF